MISDEQKLRQNKFSDKVFCGASFMSLRIKQNLRSLKDLILRSIEVFFLADLAATVINFDWRITSTESIETLICDC